MKKRWFPVVGVALSALSLLLLAQLSLGFAVAPAGAAALRPGLSLAELQAYWNTLHAAPPHLNSITYELLLKAQPDECYDDIGLPYPPGPPCDVGQPKVNQGYIWSMTQHGDRIWFGTVANTMCMFGTDLVGQGPNENAYWVCEFGESQYVPPMPAEIGDWRPPHIYTYDVATGEVVDMTPADPLVERTLGFRSAGAIGKAVILAGPDVYYGVNFFVFNGETGEFLGANRNLRFTNIRKWLEVNGVLYTAVSNPDGTGSVLRWNLDPENLTHLRRYAVVGNLDGEGAELAYHDGRIYVSTWPGDVELGNDNGALAGLYMSPPVPAEGLTREDADSWQKVWQVDDYEPDPLIAGTYGGGALASFDGYLYWGTMHVPLQALNVFYDTYGKPADPADQLAATIGCSRALAVFRGRNFDTEQPEVELLYGLSVLPSYTPEAGWTLVPNNMGVEPGYGLAGLGNVKNNYTWALTVYQDDLYLGTMDWGTITSVPTETLSLNADLTLGADLYRFPSAAEPAVAENTDGFGNFANYGVRNLLATSDALYVGTANPMNLLTDPHDELPPGGWELLRITQPSPP